MSDSDEIPLPQGLKGIARARRFKPASTTEPFTPCAQVPPAGEPIVFPRAHGRGPTVPNAPNTVRATPFVWRAPESIPPRQWLYGRHAVRSLVSATVAAGGTGKTVLELTEGLALATGRDLLDDHLRGQGRVWYIGLEDPLEEYERRVAAIAIHHNIKPSQIEGAFFLDSGRDQEFVIAREDRQGVVIAEPLVQSMIENIRANEIALVIVDPFIGCHSVSESDNTKIEKVVRQWARIAQETNCAAELVHHVRKGGAGQEPSAEDARGASALIAAARSVRILTSMNQTEADHAGVDERRRFFKVKTDKANPTIAPESSTWREMVSTSLRNGGAGPHDFVGVPQPWAYPSIFDDVTPDDLAEVQRRIRGGEWRENSQAKAWAGHVVAEVLGIDLADPRSRKRISDMLKVWIKNKALYVDERKDGNRQDKKFIVVDRPESTATL